MHAMRKPPKPQPLKRGRHGLAPKLVKASQRGRVMQAMLHVVARDGYEAATVAAVVRAARVSRKAFYELFDDRDSCFLALCEEERLQLTELTLATDDAATWIEAARRGIHLNLAWWQERPELARAYFLELPKLGELAAPQQQRVYRGFEAIFAYLAQRARREQRGLPALRARTPQILIVALTELIGAEVRAGRQARLLELEDDLVDLTVRLLADDATARRA